MSGTNSAVEDLRLLDQAMVKRGGKLVISLDFELMWGCRCQKNIQSYRENLLGVRRVVPKLLETFNEYDVRATWATVGLLFFSNLTEMKQGLPTVKPEYANPSLSPYPDIENGSIAKNENEDPFHYAHDLISLIRRYPGQEIGTHTFSHYYCLEQGQTGGDFRHDLMASICVAKQHGVQLKSLVFPRNQCKQEYLPICAELGIQAYRGNPTSRMYREASREQQFWYMRLLRFADAYLNLSGHNTYRVEEVNHNHFDLINVPASHFLRPYSRKLRALEPLRLRRILSGMRQAARHRQIYHLWWHPHNFGINLHQNLDFLRKILDYYQTLRREYDMESITMCQAAELICRASPTD